MKSAALSLNANVNYYSSSTYSAISDVSHILRRLREVKRVVDNVVFSVSHQSSSSRCLVVLVIDVQTTDKTAPLSLHFV